MSYIDDAPATRAKPRRWLRSVVGTCLLVLVGAGFAVLWRSFGEPLWHSLFADVGAPATVAAVSAPAPDAAPAPPPVAAPAPPAVASAPVKSREADDQLARIARDLEAMTQSMERLGVAQRQMAQSVAALEARQQEMAQRLSTLQAAAPHASAAGPAAPQWLADPSALAIYYAGALRRAPSNGTPAGHAANANARPPAQTGSAPPRAAAATPAPRPRPNPTP